MVAKSKPRARKKPKPIGYEGDGALDELAPDPKAAAKLARPGDGKSGDGKSSRTRAKQQHFAGMEPPRVPALDSAIEAYVSVRDQRMQLTKEEVQRRSAIEELLAANQLTEYRNEHFRAYSEVAATKVKVKRLDDDVDGDDLGDL